MTDLCTFRFQKFKDEIKTKIKIDYSNCYMADEQNDSYFINCIKNWYSLNFSPHFIKFVKNIKDNIHSLKLIIIQKDIILDEIIKLLSNGDQAIVQVSLELISALACDIREDFYDRFPEAVRVIENIINEYCKSPEILNSAFNSIAHIVYFLNKKILLDIDNGIKPFRELMTHKSQFISSFTCEVFGNILKRIPDVSKTFALISTTFTPEEYNFSAQLIYHTISSYCLYNLEKFYDTYGYLVNISKSDDFFRKTLYNLNKILISLSGNEELILESFKFLLKANKSDVTFEEIILSFLDDLVMCKKVPLVLKAIKDHIDGSSHDSTFIILAKEYLRASTDNNESDEILRNILLDEMIPLEDRISMMNEFLTWERFDDRFIPMINTIILKSNDLENESFSEFLFKTVCLQTKQIFVHSIEACGQNYLIRPVFNLNIVNTSDITKPSDRIVRVLNHFIDKSIKMQIPGEYDSSYIRSLVILTQMRPYSQISIGNLLGERVKELSVKMINSCQNLANLLTYMKELLLLTLQYVDERKEVKELKPLIQAFKQFDMKAFFQIYSEQVEMNIEDSFVISKAAEIFHILLLTRNKLAIEDKVDYPFAIIYKSLRCTSHKARTHILQSLKLLYNGSVQMGLVDKCLSAELIHVSPQNVRDILAKIIDLHLNRRDMIIDQDSILIALNYMYGLLTVNFKPIWAPIIEAIQSYSINDRSKPIPDKGQKNKPVAAISGCGTIFWDTFESIMHHTEQLIDKETKIEPMETEEDKTIEANEFTTLLDYYDFLCSDAMHSNEILTDSCIGLKSKKVNKSRRITKKENPSQDHLDCNVKIEKEALVKASLVRVDWPMYRCNVWKTVTPAILEPKNKYFIPKFLDFSQAHFMPSPNASNTETLSVFLKFIAKFTTLKTISQEDKCIEMLLDLMSHPKSDVQLLAFEAYCDNKNAILTKYKSDIIKMIDLKTFKDQSIAFKLDHIASTSERVQVSKPLLRVLFGRLLLNNKKFAPLVFANISEYNPQEIKYFMSLVLRPIGITSDDNMITALAQCVSQTKNDQNKIRWSTFQAICQSISNFIRYLGNRREAVESLFYLGIGLVSISMMKSSIQPDLVRKQMKYVRKVSGDLLITLLRNESKMSSDSHHASFLNEEHFTLITDNLLSPEIMTEFKMYAVDTPNHVIFRILALASKNAHYSDHLLNANITAHLLDMLSNGKLSTTVGCLIISIIHNVLYSEGRMNFMRNIECKIPTIAEYLSEKLLSFTNSKKKIAPTSLIEHYSLLKLIIDPPAWFGSNCQYTLDQGIIEQLLSDLIKIQLFKARTHNASRLAFGGWGRKSYKDMKNNNGILVTNNETAAILKNSLKTTDELDAEMMKLIVGLVKRAENVSKYYPEIIKLFSRTDSRVARGILTKVANEAALKLPYQLKIEYYAKLHAKGKIDANKYPDSECIVLLSKAFKFTSKRLNNDDNNVSIDNLSLVGILCEMLNLQDQTKIDEFDISVQEKAFSILTSVVKFTETVDASVNSVETRKAFIELHLAGLHNAVYHMENGSLQIRDAAIDYMLALLKKCAEMYESDKETDSADEKVEERYVNRLIIDCIWPSIQRAISEFYGPKRIHFLKLLHGTIQSLAEHPWFKPLTFLSDEKRPDNCFFVSLQSGTINRQIASLKRLVKFLSTPQSFMSRAIARTILQPNQPFLIPQHHLRGLLLPLVLFYLRSELNTDNPVARYANSQNSEKLLRDELIKLSVEALGKIAFRLNWANYRSILDSAIAYLIDQSKKNAKTDLAIDAITTILDSFVSPDWTEKSEKMEIQEDEEDEYQDLADEEEDDEESDDELREEEQKILSMKELFNEMHHDPFERVVLDEDKSKIQDYLLVVMKRLQKFILVSNNTMLLKKKNSDMSSSVHIPLTISLVTLLKKLPKGQLEASLPAINLRLLASLRPSKKNTPEIRKDVISALGKIARLLHGGRAFDDFICTIAHQLNKGYAAHQVRLFTLTQILSNVEQAARNGNWLYKNGDFDKIARLMTRLYLDESIGQLGESIDNRKMAGKSLLTSTSRKGLVDGPVALDELASQDIPDLPEAKCLKAPDGMSMLCRIVSSKGLSQLFTDLSIAVRNVSAGSSLKVKHGEEDDENAKEEKGPKKIGCGIKYRKRAISRLENVLVRLPTKAGFLAMKQQLCKLDPLDILNICLSVVVDNVPLVLPKEHKIISNPIAKEFLVSKANGSHVPAQWATCRSEYLAPKWDYLGIPPEPKRMAAVSSHTSQSQLSQLHIFIQMALNGLVHLITPKISVDIMRNVLDHVLVSLDTTSLKIQLAGLRCIYKFLVIHSLSGKGENEFEVFTTDQLSRTVRKLFQILSQNVGTLSGSMSARDQVTATFGHVLFNVFSLFLRSKKQLNIDDEQLAVLLDTVEIELSREKKASSILYLLLAILQRRLKHDDATGDKEEKEILFSRKTLDQYVETLNKLSKAKATDTDQSKETGAGGGSRLVKILNTHVRDIIITSGEDSILRLARKCFLTYLFNYPHSVKYITNSLLYFLECLSHKKAKARESAIICLHDMVRQFSSQHLIIDNQHEILFLAVAAAIQRETSVNNKITMLKVLRALFSRLPEKNACELFENHVMEYLIARKDKHLSVRLLALQIIPFIVNCHSELGLEKVENRILTAILSDIIPSTLTKVKLLQKTNPELFQKDTKDFVQDVDFMNEHCEEGQAMDTSENFAPMIDNEQQDSDDEQSEEEMSIASEGEAEEEMEEFSPDAHIPSTGKLSLDTKFNDLSSSAAGTRYYNLFSILESSLSFIYTMFLSERTDESRLQEFLASNNSAKLFSFILQHSLDKKALNLEDGTFDRVEHFSALLSFHPDEKMTRDAKDFDQFGLLDMPHDGVVEYSVKCLSSLSRFETVRLFNESPTYDEKSGQYNPKSAFWKKNRGKLSKFRIHQDDPFTVYGESLYKTLLLCCRSFEISTTNIYCNVEWVETYLVPTLIRLAILAHVEVGRIGPMYFLRMANRLSLDELNNRRNSLIQRSLCLKMTVIFLEKCPKSKSENLNELKLYQKKTQKDDILTDETEEKAAHFEGDLILPSLLAYLRVVSRIIQREKKHQDKLAFIALSSIPDKMELETTGADYMSASKKLLSGQMSVRAKNRRKRREAQLKRALLSEDSKVSEEAMNKIFSLNSLVGRKSAAIADEIVKMISEADDVIVSSLVDPEDETVDRQDAKMFWKNLCYKTESFNIKKKADKRVRDLVKVAKSEGIKKKRRKTEA